MQEKEMKQQVLLDRDLKPFLALQSTYNIPQCDKYQSQLFIGPESDHWQCLSVTDWLTHSLTHCRLVNFIDVSLACEDGNSKLVEVVTVVEVDEKHVDNSLVQIWKINFGHKVKFLFRLWE